MRLASTLYDHMNRIHKSAKGKPQYAHRGLNSIHKGRGLKQETRAGNKVREGGEVVTAGRGVLPHSLHHKETHPGYKSLEMPHLQFPWHRYLQRIHVYAESDHVVLENTRLCRYSHGIRQERGHKPQTSFFSPGPLSRWLYCCIIRWFSFIRSVGWGICDAVGSSRDKGSQFSDVVMLKLTVWYFSANTQVVIG